MFRILTAFFLCIALTFAAASAQPAPEETQAEDLAWHADDDPAMLAAYAQARASMTHFWEVFEKSDHEDTEPSMKAGLPTNDDRLEHIWVTPVSLKEGVYTATLANDPYDLKGGLELGDTVTFRVEEISDWAYWEGAKMRGHFSTRLLLGGMSEDDARELKKVLHKKPMP